jgi:hypothetical protein
MTLTHRYRNCKHAIKRKFPNEGDRITKMAKTKKSGKKGKKRISSREIIAGLIVIVALLVALALVVWLIMPMAGQRAVPRKFRGFQQSWLECPVNREQIALT